MMRLMQYMGLALLFIAGIAAGFLLSNGRRQTWEMLSGPADMGPVHFEELVRSPTGNDALACPPGWCAKAQSDFDPPVYALNLVALSQRFRESLDAEEKLELIGDSQGLHFRYVQYTPWMEWPDTISVVFMPLGADQSTLAIYSRSRFGDGDLGTNLKRIKRWLQRLEKWEIQRGRQA
ncbi:MAG: DUF1499 domain-containing protein [Rhizobiaceae bacterium]